MTTLLEQAVKRQEMGEFGLDPSLVLYLPLYMLDGSSFMSRDGYGHLATVTGALWIPQGGTFDGSDDVITLPNTALLKPALSSWSIGVWLKCTKTARQHIAGIDAASDSYHMAIEATTNYLWLRFGDAGIFDNIKGSVDMNDSLWHYCVGVRNETDGKLYLYMDTIQAATPVTATNTTGQSIDPDAAFTIGRLVGGTLPFGGTIGAVRIYNRALSPLEIQQVYLATKWRYS